MIEKTLKAVVAEGVQALENMAIGLKADMNHSLQTVEQYKRLLGELVKLSGEVQKTEFFANAAALKIGEVTLYGDNNRAHMGLQMGNGGGGFIQLSGVPTSDEILPQGRYRIVVMLHKAGDL